MVAHGQLTQPDVRGIIHIIFRHPGPSAYNILIKSFHIIYPVTFKHYITFVSGPGRDFRNAIHIHIRLRLGQNIASKATIHQKIERKILVRQHMIPAQHQFWIGIAHFHRIAITFHQRHAGIVSFRAVNDIARIVTYKSFSVDVTDRAPFHQFHGITGREAGRTVKKLLQRFVQ